MPRVLRQPLPDSSWTEGDYEPPEGYHYEWVESDRHDERFATREENLTRKCRRPGCRWKVGWALLRTNGSHAKVWWLYCFEHNYGRKFEGKKILHRKLVPNEA